MNEWKNLAFGIFLMWIEEINNYFSWSLDLIVCPCRYINEYLILKKIFLFI